MIPLVAITNGVNALICAVIAIRLLVMYDYRPRSGLASFIGFYAGFGVFWFLYTLPGLVLIDVYSVTVVHILGYFFFFLAMVSVVQMPLVFLQAPKWIRLLAAILVSMLGVIYFTGRLFESKLSYLVINPPYYFWADGYVSLVWALPGFAGLAATITVAVLFGYLALGRQPRLAKRAAVFMMSGMLVLVTAAFVYFIFGNGSFFSSILATALSAVALLIILRGIMFMQQVTDEEIEGHVGREIESSSSSYVRTQSLGI